MTTKNQKKLTLQDLRWAVNTASQWTGMEWDSDLKTLASELAKAGSDASALRRVAKRWEDEPIHSWANTDNGSYASQKTRRDLDRLSEMVQDGDTDALSLAEYLRDEESASVEAEAKEAAEHGEAAVAAVEAGDWGEAEREIEYACRLERQYGDDPNWRPVAEMIDEMVEDASSIMFTSSEVRYAIELLDAPGDAEDRVEETVRILMRDMSEERARELVRQALEEIS